MLQLDALKVLSATAGLLVSVLVVAFPRFGTGSWRLAMFLALGSLSAGILGAPESFERWTGWSGAPVAFGLLVLAAPAGAWFSLTFRREHAGQVLELWKWFLVPSVGAAPALVALCAAFQPQPGPTVEIPEGHHLLGPFGFFAALYLVVLSVFALAQLERTLRSAEEEVRWEIKFLVLGLAGSFATLVYVASRVLLYSWRLAFVAEDTLAVFPLVFLLTLLLVVLSWRRSTGRGRVVVSQGVVYSSITLLGVGYYLVASSLLGRWAGTIFGGQVEFEAVVFLLAVLVLGGAILSTRFRGRLRHWVRQNFFSGQYDYRRFWLDASGSLRAGDPPEEIASALIGLVQRALRVEEVSVWLCTPDGKKLRLVTAAGRVEWSPGSELCQAKDVLDRIEEPLSGREWLQQVEPDLGDDFLERARAKLLVPLRSGGETIGLLTVGSDRSGLPFGSEVAEFVGALTSHAAGELHKTELLASQVEAREAEAFRSFSSFLLHDLKNFASTLSMIAKNAVRHHGNPEFQKDAFRSVLETSEKMKRLCNSLRTFSSVLAANKKLGDLNEVVREVAVSLEGSLRTRLRLELHDVPPILMDREEVIRVVQNLVINAREATSDDGSITLQTASRNGGVELSVVDDGVGFPRAFLERDLFLPFRTTKSDGLGIGLFQSKKIVEAHGGTIGVESKIGEGTAVRAWLPIVVQGDHTSSEV